MKYSKLPTIYKQIVPESLLLDFYNRDWYENEKLDEDSLDILADYLAEQFSPVVESIDLDGPDDFMLSGYLQAGPWASERDKDETVTMKLHGQFQFCVYGCEKYGKKAFATLSKALTSKKFNGFKITDLSQPEDTPGISFNGIYQNADTVYISGWYEFSEVTVDVAVPKTQKYVVDILPYDANFLPLRIKITAPKGSSDEQLKEIVINDYENKLLDLVAWKDIQFKDYGDGYFECTVTITFNRNQYKIYLDNETSENLRYNDNTSARMCAWAQLLEDLEVEDVTRFS